MKRRLADEWAVFLLAVQFLTRLPLRPAPVYSPQAMAASPRWYPGAGLLIGAAVGGVFWLAAQVYPGVLAALLSTAAGLMLTGCLHEDGLADFCDGLGGGASRERALEIMRDSRIGTFGAAGLGMVLAGKMLALAAMPAGAAALLLVAGHGASRASCVVVIATSRYARAEGVGAPLSGGLGWGGLGFAVATGLAGLAALSVVLPAASVACGLVGMALAHVAIRAVFERRLQGYTGDCLGAVQQTGELALYLGVLACL